MRTQRFLLLIPSAATLLLSAACAPESDSAQSEGPQVPAAVVGAADTAEPPGPHARIQPEPAAAGPEVFDPSREGTQARSAQRDEAEIGIKPASPRDRDRYYEARERAKNR